MTAVRYWLADVLLDIVRRVYPGKRRGVWQIIEVPRRISRTEADSLANQVRDL